MEKADRERQALFEAYPILRQLQLDFNSYKPIEQQKEEGLESLQEAMLERQLRVQAAKEEWRLEKSRKRRVTGENIADEDDVNKRGRPGTPSEEGGGEPAVLGANDVSVSLMYVLVHLSFYYPPGKFSRQSTQGYSFCTCETCTSSLRQRMSEEYEPDKFPSFEEMLDYYNVSHELLQSKLPHLNEALLNFHANEVGVKLSNGVRAQRRQVHREEQDHTTHFEPDKMEVGVIVFGVTIVKLWQQYETARNTGYMMIYSPEHLSTG